MDVKNCLLAAMMAAGLMLTSCGSPSEETGATCDSAACTEAELNAPLPGSQDDTRPPNTDDPVVVYDPPVFDPSWGLPEEMYAKAVAYYKANIGLITNTRFLTIIDFTRNSNEKRFFLFDLREGTFERHNTSHGTNSDTDKDGFATDFSNEVNSHKSSLGFYLTLNTYTGKNGRSLKLRGLEESNSNAEQRAVVVHAARYVSNSKSKAGMSWGCPALDPTVTQGVIDRIRAGSLMLIDRVLPNR